MLFSPMRSRKTYYFGRPRGSKSPLLPYFYLSLNIFSCSLLLSRVDLVRFFHFIPACLLRFDCLAGIRFLRPSSPLRLAHLGHRVAHSHGLERGGQASGDQGGSQISEETAPGIPNQTWNQLTILK